MMKLQFNKTHRENMKKTLAFLLLGIILSVLLLIGVLKSSWDIALYAVTTFGIFAFLDLVTREYWFDKATIRRVHRVGSFHISVKRVSIDRITNVRFGKNNFYGILPEEALLIGYNGHRLVISEDFDRVNDLHNVLIEMLDSKVIED